MDVIPKSHIARVVLAYLYEQKLTRAAEEFCKSSPYLREEKQFLKHGSRPSMIFHAKLVDLFRQYGEIQIKVNNFVEKYGDELKIPSDASLVRKVDFLLWVIRKARRSSAGGADKGEHPKVPQSAGSKRFRARASPHPSLSSSTPEVGEPKQKRVRLDNSYIVLNETGSGRNLSNLSHISAITDGDSTQDSVAGEGAQTAESKEEEEREATEPSGDGGEELNKFPSMELFSQTLLENANYSVKIADLINKGLETSTNTQVDPREGPSSAYVEPASEAPRDQPNDNQSFNINLEEIISNIVNSAVQDPVFDGIMEDITSKAIKTQNTKEGEKEDVTPPPETPLKDRLRKTCKKNYNPASVRKSAKKVKVISDVPFYGTISAVVDPDTSVVQPEVSSTENPQVAPISGATQFYVIQPDNSTKLMDINQLQFPTQQISIPETSAIAQVPPTLISIPNSGFQEPTYYLSYFIETGSQLPMIPANYPTGFTEPTVSNSLVPSQPEILPSPDKFLIFPVSSSSAVSNPSSDSVTIACTTTAAISTGTTTTTATTSSIVCSILPKIEPAATAAPATGTPQSYVVSNPKAKCASTPSRKAAHIRFLNFHTPAKPVDQRPHIATPTSAPASVDHRKNHRLPAIAPKPPPLVPITENEYPTLAQSSNAPGPSTSGTPRVAKDPRTCVRVLSRSASEGGDEPDECPERKPEIVEATVNPATAATAAVAPSPQPLANPAPKPMVEIPASEVSRKKLASTSNIDLEEWRRIRSVSKANFDQHLRQVEEQRQLQIPRPQPKKKKKKPTRRKSVPVVEQNDSLETTPVEHSSLTEEHAQMLEDALASAKKDDTKASAKTPAKTKASKVIEELRQDKIYVKITTPKKRTPGKLSPKRRMSRSGQSAKKKRVSSPRKSVKEEPKPQTDEPAETAEMEDVILEETPNEVVVVTSSESLVPPADGDGESPDVPLDRTPEIEQPPQQEEKQDPEENQEPANPSKSGEPSHNVSQKEQLQPQSQEQQQQEDKETEEPANSSKLSEFSFNASQLLQTPFKIDLPSCPVTPRFLVPSPMPITPMTKTNRDTSSGCDGASSLTKGCDIQTPSFPITPGLISTPISISSVSPQSHAGGASRRTDYSSGGSYYRPDESEDLDQNLEAMQLAERKKRMAAKSVAPTVEPSAVAPPKDDEPEDQPPSPAKSAAASNSSGESSSSSSDSSSDSSSSESSPEKAPAPAPKSQLRQTPSKFQNSLAEARRRQIFELEAKRNRTIARMKCSKAPTPKKPTDRKLLTAAKTRTAILAAAQREKQIVKPPIARAPLVPRPKNPPGKAAIAKAMVVTSTTSSKRKNPTPRKVVMVERLIPQPVRMRNSPKRKVPVQRTPRASLVITDEDLPKIITPRKDQLIEGTYESENLSRLCCTPDLPLESSLDDEKSKDIGLKTANEVSPDCDKENQRINNNVNGNNDGDDDSSSSSSEEEEDEDDYDTCSLRKADEDAGFHFVYADQRSDTDPTSTCSGCHVIGKLNVVIEDRKVCLQPQEPFTLFELAPSKTVSGGSSGTISKKDSKTTAKSTSKKGAGKSGTSVTPPVPPASTKTEHEKKGELQPVPAAGAVRAKLNIVSAVRESVHSSHSAKKVAQQSQQSHRGAVQQSRLGTVASKCEEKKDEAKAVKTVPPQTETVEDRNRTQKTLAKRRISICCQRFQEDF
ncbi:microtubule-associated protein futsch-like isoform X2 [Toxorhynchites rutilus septentrionalis]|uniref:microtubule-associated protein futsch-like isoform X2 n=1 Tax=Toxorhynchites rutilus septentrionalis TaxID=329112 RepID=UPI00247B20B4|nr:microtubule-associated protein futsch-like isoform X2 [Toxorhynchites rutilus septentrionalis]